MPRALLALLVLAVSAPLAAQTPVFEIRDASGAALLFAINDDGTATCTNCVVTDALADGAVTGEKIAPDAIQAGSGVTVTRDSSANLVIGASGGGGFALPYAGTAAAGSPTFRVENTGSGAGGHFVSGGQVALVASAASGTGLTLSGAVDGAYVASAGEAGLRIGTAGERGVEIETAGTDGLYVGQAGGDGVHVAGATGRAGYFDGIVEVTTRLQTPVLSAGGGSDLEVSLGGLRALLVSPTTANDAPNLIGGHERNGVLDGTVRGASIGGGGRFDSDDLAPNQVLGSYGTVGGGLGNTSGSEAVVGGGRGNAANAGNSVVAGGQQNRADGFQSAIGGGLLNVNEGTQAVIAGGLRNTVTATTAFLGGGEDNVAAGWRSAVAGGKGNRAGGQNAGVLAGGGNTASGEGAGVVAGNGNTASGQNAFLGAGQNNESAGGTGVVGGGLNNRTAASSSVAVIAGGSDNVVEGAAPVLGASIGGGVSNAVTDNYGVVSGGWDNEAGYRASVGGGQGNLASGDLAAVAGGFSNTASGAKAFVAGGGNNRATGENSFAAGAGAQALHDGSFVWSGQQANGDVTLATTDRFQFLVRAKGGATFYSSDVSHGVTLFPGDNTWTSTSSRATKDGFEAVDPADVLARVADLDVQRWHYRSGPGIVHMGPMAEDFYAAFGLGATNRGISVVDADGVALAAIQGLLARVEALEAEVRHLRETRPGAAPPPPGP